MAYPVNDEKLRWPFGKADLQSGIAYAATRSINISNSKTVLRFATLTGDTTLTLVASPEQEVGDEILLRIPATANGDDMSFAGNVTAPPVVGVAGKTKTLLLVYDGTAFVPAGPSVQID